MQDVEIGYQQLSIAHQNTRRHKNHDFVTTSRRLHQRAQDESDGDDVGMYNRAIPTAKAVQSHQNQWVLHARYSAMHMQPK